jgi:hypothetical protein
VTADDRTGIPPSVPEVLRYFLNHPGAAGSERDLIEFRVQREIAAHTAAQLREAIDWLLKEQFLVPTILRLNVDRLAEAEAIVNGAERQDLAEVPVHPDAAPQPDAPLDNARPVAEPSRPGLREVPRSPETPDPSFAEGPLATACLTWIDATLRRYYSQNPLAPTDNPGLSRGAATIERLLAPVVANAAADPQTDADADRTLAEAFRDADDRDPLARLVWRLALEPREVQAFVLCLAPAVDAKYQTLYGVFNDDLHGRRAVTLGLLCRLLGEPLEIRQELERDGNLARWRLFDDAGATLPHADQPLRIDPLIVAWLFQQSAALTRDPRLAAFLRRRPWAGARWLRDEDEIRIVYRLSDLLTNETESQWVALAGSERNGTRASLEAAAALAKLPLVRIVPPLAAPTDPAEIDDIARRIARAVRLEDAVAAVDAALLANEAAESTLLARLLAPLSEGPRPVIVLARDIERIVAALPRSHGRCIRITAPPGAALAAVYATAAEEAGLAIDGAQAGRLALAYPMPLDSIEDAVRLALLNGASARSADEQFAAFSEACRRVACPDLPRFGRRVEPVFRFADVVLPDRQHAELGEIVSHVRHAAQVMHAWGFAEQLPYGRGVTALFSGPSGTGKTMAAQAIARELDTDAYVVDLSRVVSKYIGESEKNLDAVFSDAERAGAVLVFDEADALFGKRSEIKDAHDRYANIEVAYLLQRMEAFGGLAILTTNFRQNLDQAFVRRIRFIVDFQRPDEKAREAIWQRCLGGRDTPVAPTINFRFLARRLELTGGTIQQIAIRAAFAAASDQAPRIEMKHVLSAARAEALKLGLTVTERELAAFEAAFRRTDVA